MSRMWRGATGASPGRFLLIISAAVWWLVPVVTGCSGGDDLATRSGPNVPASIESPLPTETVIRFEDPATLTTYLIERSEAEDWAAVREQMVTPFRQFTVENIARLTNVHVFETAEWHVDQYDDFAVARVTDEGISVMPFVRNEDGVWHYDPGIRILRSLEVIETLEHSGTTRAPADYEQRVESDLDDVKVHEELFQHKPMALKFTEAGTELMIEWAFINHSAARLPVDNVTWVLGSESGHAEVTWTVAEWGDNELRFPVPPAYAEITDSRKINVPYSTTFLMNGLPESWDGLLELRIDDLVIEQEDQEYVLDLIYEIPATEFPEPVQ